LVLWRHRAGAPGAPRRYAGIMAEGDDATVCPESTRSSTTAVIVSYNTAELLEVCVESLLPQLSGDDRLVVVDNASTDGSAERIRTRYPSVDVVARSSNVGFGRGCNEGAARHDGEFVLLFNPDAQAMPGMLDALHRAATVSPDSGIYGGRCLGRDGATDPRSCWGKPTVWSTFCFASGLSTIFKRSRIFDPESLGRWDRTTQRNVDVVSGALLMIDRALWERLGGFDPRYFMYGEDLDLCLRAGLLGAAPVLVPEATMFHEIGASSTRADQRCLLLAGKITAIVDHNPGWRGRTMRGLTIAGCGVRAILGRPFGTSWVSAWSRRSEWWDGYPAGELSRVAHRSLTRSADGSDDSTAEESPR
jgi:N-acetylglucosaminyl-diphospho-decaprenol L-rhamnosyltransferase